MVEPDGPADNRRREAVAAVTWREACHGRRLPPIGQVDSAFATAPSQQATCALSVPSLQRSRIGSPRADTGARRDDLAETEAALDVEAPTTRTSCITE